jgi:dual specificity MAP kinase phosphatase
MDISQITDYLYVGAQPSATDAEQLGALNVRLIISMSGMVRPPEALTRPPLKMLWLQTFDTIFTPIPISKLAMGVQAALPVIQNGGRVFVHCREGRHRGVAMGAAILIAMGYSAKDAMRLLKAKREVADPQAWHIQWRIREFEKYWHKNGK